MADEKFSDQPESKDMDGPKINGHGRPGDANTPLLPGFVTPSLRERGKADRMAAEHIRLGGYSQLIKDYIEQFPAWEQHVRREVHTMAVESLVSYLDNAERPIPSEFIIPLSIPVKISIRDLVLAPTPHTKEELERLRQEYEAAHRNEAPPEEECRCPEDTEQWFNEWRWAFYLREIWTEYREREGNVFPDTMTFWNFPVSNEADLESNAETRIFRLETLQALIANDPDGLKIPGAESAEAKEGRELFKKLSPEGAFSRKPAEFLLEGQTTNKETGEIKKFAFSISIHILPLTFDFRNAEGGETAEPSTYFPIAVRWRQIDSKTPFEEISDEEFTAVFQDLLENIDSRISSVPSGVEGDHSQKKKRVRRKPRPPELYTGITRSPHAVISHTLGKFTPVFQPDLFESIMAKASPELVAAVEKEKVSIIGYDFTAPQLRILHAVMHLNKLYKYPSDGILSVSRDELAEAAGLEKITNKNGSLHYSGGEIARMIIDLQGIAMTSGMIHVSTVSKITEDGEPRFNVERRVAPLFTLSFKGSNLTPEEEHGLKMGGMTEEIASKVRRFEIILNELWNPREYFYIPDDLNTRTIGTYRTMLREAGKRNYVRIPPAVLNFRNWLLQQGALKEHAFKTGKAVSFVVSESFEHLAYQCRMQKLLSARKYRSIENAIKTGAELCKRIGILTDWRKELDGAGKPVYHFTFTDEKGVISPFYQEIEKQRSLMENAKKFKDEQRRQRIAAKLEKSAKKHPPVPEAFQSELESVRKARLEEFRRRLSEYRDKGFSTSRKAIDTLLSEWEEEKANVSKKSGDPAQKKATVEMLKGLIITAKAELKGGALPSIKPHSAPAQEKKETPVDLPQSEDEPPSKHPAASSIWEAHFTRQVSELKENSRNKVSEAVPCDLIEMGGKRVLVLWFPKPGPLALFMKEGGFFTRCADEAAVSIAWVMPGQPEPKIEI